MFETDVRRQAELVLRGNILLADYEQQRVDPIVRCALSLFPSRLLDDDADDGPLLVVRDKKPWALEDTGVVRSAIDRTYSWIVTKWRMAIVLPAGASLQVAERAHPRRSTDCRARAARNRCIRRGCRRCRIRRSSEIWARARSRAWLAIGRARAKNWTRIDDRMNCIVNVFRARQAQGRAVRGRAAHAGGAGVGRRRARRRRVHDATAVHGRISRRVCATCGDPGRRRGGRGLRARRRRRRSALPRAAAHRAPARRLPPAEQVPVRARVLRRAMPRSPRGRTSTQLQRGQRFFNVFGVHIASALFCGSLPMSYTAADGAQVLTHTMALVSDTRRRLAQTGEMLLDVMGANDGAGSRSVRAATRPRSARRTVCGCSTPRSGYMLRNDPSYDRDALGEPINQEDQLGTLLAFTVVVIDALERFGVPTCPMPIATRTCSCGSPPATFLGHRSGAPAEPAARTTRFRCSGTRWSSSQTRSPVATRPRASRDRLLMRALLAEESEALPFPLRGLATRVHAPPDRRRLQRRPGRSAWRAGPRPAPTTACS